MSDRPTDPAHAEASDTVRRLPAVPADPAFRARLQREFSSGTIVSPASGEATQQSRSALALLLASWVRRLGRPWVGSLAGIGVAALVAISLLARVDRGPGWQVIGSMGQGQVLLDGEAIDPSGTTSAIPAGTTISTLGDVTLDLVCDGFAVMQLAPGTEISVPGVPRRFLARQVEMRVTRGEVRFSTGPRFVGRRLTIHSAAGRVSVLGTTFAVLCDEDSTCVCVLDGVVRFEPTALNGEARTPFVVPAGERHSVFLTSPEVRREVIHPGERMKLEMLRAAGVDRLR